MVVLLRKGSDQCQTANSQQHLYNADLERSLQIVTRSICHCPKSHPIASAGCIKQPMVMLLTPCLSTNCRHSVAYNAPRSLMATVHVDVAHPTALPCLQELVDMHVHGAYAAFHGCRYLATHRYNISMTHLVDQIASPFPKALFETRTTLDLDAWPTPQDYYHNIRTGELWDRERHLTDM